METEFKAGALALAGRECQPQPGCRHSPSRALVRSLDSPMRAVLQRLTHPFRITLHRRSMQL